MVSIEELKKEASNLDITKMVAGVVMMQKLQSFIEPEKASNEEALGLAVSHYCNWNGAQILEVCAEALEDANFHAESAKLREMVEAL